MRRYLTVIGSIKIGLTNRPSRILGAERVLEEGVKSWGVASQTQRMQKSNVGRVKVIKIQGRM